jgi:hypothetical protein
MIETALPRRVQNGNSQAAKASHNEERKMRPIYHSRSELHRFNGRQHKLTPNWARPLIKYGALVVLVAACLWLAIESLF